MGGYWKRNIDKWKSYFPVNFSLFEDKNGNTSTMCEILSTLTIRTPERLLYCYLLTYLTHSSGVPIVAFEQENADWLG